MDTDTLRAAGHLENPRGWRTISTVAVQPNCAKRLECAELAPAFGRTAPFESASKLVALHTLRAAGHLENSRGLPTFSTVAVRRGKASMEQERQHGAGQICHMVDGRMNRVAVRDGSQAAPDAKATPS